MEEWQLITDKSGDLLGKRGLWDKYPLVLRTADNTASARQRVWGETIFKDITKIMCIHLNKNNSKLAFLPWKWLRFSRDFMCLYSGTSVKKTCFLGKQMEKSSDPAT